MKSFISSELRGTDLNVFFFLTNIYSKILQVKTINTTIPELHNRKNSGFRPIPFTELINEKTEAQKNYKPSEMLKVFLRNVSLKPKVP